MTILGSPMSTATTLWMKLRLMMRIATDKPVVFNCRLKQDQNGDLSFDADNRPVWVTCCDIRGYWANDPREMRMPMRPDGAIYETDWSGLSAALARLMNANPQDMAALDLLAHVIKEDTDSKEDTES